MSPRLYQYRITYRVGGQSHEWTRSGTGKAKVESLMRRALELMYRGRAELVSVELVDPDALPPGAGDA